LFGIAFWGIAVSVALLWITFGAVAFLLFYDASKELTRTVMISIVAFFICWLAKELALIFFRANWYKGFYRLKPAQANILNAVMDDCWNLGFSLMYIVARVVKIFVAMAVNLGRVDMPFLAREVTTLGPHNLDGFPVFYHKDLLIHDAHRHPYLERLGLIYLLKFRLGPQFGSRFGSAWRIFVLSCTYAVVEKISANLHST
jgi:hypothetical protein